ncbi:MAG TPA: aminotransferase class V-fold PLP-dependent enzyme [Tepidisphaeraceae bacterium]|jgi:cysteine desulfurase
MSLRLPIYLDYNATTPVDPRVFETMRPYFTETFGNAASTSHAFGRVAQDAVVRARNQVAALFNVERDERQGAREIIWTSGATESNNLAIKGVAATYRGKGRHIITQATEHKAVLDPCQRLESEGFEVTWLPTNRYGRVCAEQVAEAIRPDTILVSIMVANNETGTIQPIHDIGAVCRARGVFLHTDATQAVGKAPIDVEADAIDLLSLSAHKLYGPKGCGALFVRRKGPRVRLAALLDGGGHERGYRSGTLNVPGIVGLGAACEIAREEMPAESRRLAALRDKLESRILSSLERVFVNGDTFHRLPNVSNLSFADADGSSILRGLDDIAVSSGSACTSASLQASHVLRAMGLSDDLAYNSIRFSLGRFTTDAEVDYAAEKVIRLVRALRGIGVSAGECNVSCG